MGGDNVAYNATGAGHLLYDAVEDCVELKKWSSKWFSCYLLPFILPKKIPGNEDPRSCFSFWLFAFAPLFLNLIPQLFT